MKSPPPAALATFFVLGLFFLVPAPAGAQGTNPTTTVVVTATPTGSWNADGYLDAGNETATWSVRAEITFSQNTVCADPVPVRMETLDVTHAAQAGVEPARQTVSVPNGGGMVSANGNATLTLHADALANETQSARLHVAVDRCPSTVSSLAPVETNVTLTVQPLLRPRLDVDFDASYSYERFFNFTVRNTGNGPLRVAVSAAPANGTPEQTVRLPDPVRIAAGAPSLMTIEFVAPVPGSYDVTFDGSFDGPNATQLPRVTFTKRVEILERQRVVETVPKAPGFDVVAAAVAAAFGLGLSRFYVR